MKVRHDRMAALAKHAKTVPAEDTTEFVLWAIQRRRELAATGEAPEQPRQLQPDPTGEAEATS
jgi:hypothetical protein